MDKMKDQEKEMYIVADIAANCTCGKQEEINSTEWHLYRESFIEGYKQGFEAGVRAAEEEMAGRRCGGCKYSNKTNIASLQCDELGRLVDKDFFCKLWQPKHFEAKEDSNETTKA